MVITGDQHLLDRILVTNIYLIESCRPALLDRILLLCAVDQLMHMEKSSKVRWVCLLFVSTANEV